MLRSLFLFLSLQFALLCSSQNRHDILITELMVDPTPQNSLPAVEWVELKNISASSVDLSGWRIKDATGQSGPFPSFILEPDSIVIICSNSSAGALSSFGRVISVTSFPSLDNEGEELSLVSVTNQVIHALRYSAEWYGNALKKEGGWTLEMIDTRFPCAGKDNWKASIDPGGGTPGKANSLMGSISDQKPPSIKYSFISADVEMVIRFDEPLDILSATSLQNFAIDHNRTILSAEIIEPLNDAIKLTINEPFQPGTIHQVSISQVADCSGNILPAGTIVRIGKPAQAQAGDIIINEILFDPRPNAYDYVEILNVGDSIIDASTIFLANRSASGDINTIRSISENPIYIYPGDYFVLTADAENLTHNYLVRDLRTILTVNSMPSYPDDEGTVVLLDVQGNVIDEVHYFDDWHFSLITDPEGVSLERIDPLSPSNNPDNWHSAATTAGYGTPGYRNSQYLLSPQSIDIITVEPSRFSPDNDGQNDIVRISYKVSNPGGIANATIYDASGRVARLLVRNNLLALEGYWTWDGLDDKGAALPIGPYILYTEIFNLEGKKQRFKNLIILGRRLK